MGGRSVEAHGLSTHFLHDIYYYSMTSSWPVFFLAIALAFFVFNVLFAGVYMLGDQPIGNLSPNNFLGYFFFSVETLATVGYGDMHPQTVYAHSVATAEIFVGMSSIALVTGIVFARFSRPRSSIVFADHPVSHVVDGRRILLIRIANARMNIISEASAKLRLMRDEVSPVTGNFLKIIDLKLEREHHPVFMLGWTIIHVIDEDSPLFNQTPEQLKKVNAALILSVEGVDETTSQMQRARHYYPCNLIRWNHRYIDILTTNGHDTPQLQYGKFHDSEEISDTVSG
ncbi:MAG: Inward rectifier potassium channel [Burkholderiales bacterium]|nr:Inward rectifier potassium channel [Burkholderiales bacterium]